MMSPSVSHTPTSFLFPTVTSLVIDESYVDVESWSILTDREQLGKAHPLSFIYDPLLGTESNNSGW